MYLRLSCYCQLKPGGVFPARLTAMKEERDGWSPDDHDYQPDDVDDLDEMSLAEEPVRARHVDSSLSSSKRMLEVPLSGGSVDDGYRYFTASRSSR